MRLANQPKIEFITKSSHSTPSLPEGWVESKLDEVLHTLESGSRPKGGVRGIKEGVPSIGGEHLNENGGFRFESIKFVPYSFFEKMKRGRIQAGDILIVKDGATTGKVALVRVDFPYDPAVVNEHVFICRPVTSVYSPFLFWFLFSKEGQDRILENFRGSAQGGINQSFAPGTTVPFAPLAEQKRIVAKVEELLTRVNAARERLAKVQEIMKRFRQSVLTAACSGRLTGDWRERYPDVEPATHLLKRINNERIRAQEHRTMGQKRKENTLSIISREDELPEEWAWATLSDLLHYRRSAAYGVLQPGPHLSDGVPMIRVCDIQNGGILIDQLKRIAPEIEAQYQRTRLQGEEVLVTLVGSIGRTAVVPEKAIGANVARAVAMLPLCSHILPHFVQYMLAEPRKNEELVELSREVARKTLNLGLLKAVRVPLAPTAEQREIVRRVQALFVLANAIEKHVKVAAGLSERLTQAILATAFRGELVPTEAELARREGRSYEPASALLAKIKAERKDVKPQQKRRGSNRGRN